MTPKQLVKKHPQFGDKLLRYYGVYMTWKELDTLLTTIQQEIRDHQA